MEILRQALPQVQPLHAPQTRAGERLPSPVDGYVGRVGGGGDLQTFRSLAQQFRPAVELKYPPPPPEYAPAGPTPDLAGRLQDVRDPLGRPVDGAGVKVGIIDMFNERSGEVGHHAAGVEDVARAVAPGAGTQLYSPVRGGELKDMEGNPEDPVLPADLQDDPAALRQALFEASPDYLKGVTRRLHQLADDPHRDPAMRVLNMSLGSSRSDYYEVLRKTLEQPGEGGGYRYPGLREEVLGPGNLDADEQARRIAAYTDAQLDRPGSAYSRAHGNYCRATARLAGPPNNLQIVVANGNKGPSKPGQKPREEAIRDGYARWDRAHPGSTISDFSRSPDVITVANFDLTRKGMFATSARGDGRENGPGQPTMLAAPGNGISPAHEPSTSAATPYVAGTLALMLQANPGLTPAQLREILTTTAERQPGVDARVQGAGLIDAEAAVRAAASWR